MEVATERKTVSIDDFAPYSQASAKLASLEAQLLEVTQGSPGLTEAFTRAEQESIMAEASALVEGGDHKSVKAARTKVDEIRQKMAEVDRRRTVLEEAVKMQRQKVNALLPAAREHLQRAARKAHAPIVHEMLEILRAYAEKAKEHEDLITQVVKAQGGGLYGTLIQPNAPDAASILRIIAGIEEQLRTQGYEPPS